MEYDDEIQAGKNSYTTQFRQYDPRLGRWKSLDPVTKDHESPYTSNGNNPIWFMDPTGADSIKAEGSNTWQWQVQKGETYNSISKRTGVSVEDLRYFNQNEIKDDTQIPKDAIIRISDPACPEPRKAVVQTSEGRVEIDLAKSMNIDATVRQTGEKREVKGAVMGLNFKPKQGNLDNGSQFVWFKTVVNNDDARNPDGSRRKLTVDRPLTEEAYAYDIDAGNRAGNALDGRKILSGDIWKKTSSFPFLDTPKRLCTNSGNIKWRAVLQLYKVIEGDYELITTFYYGFDVENYESKLTLLRNEPDSERIESKLLQEQNKSFQNWKNR